MTGPLPEFLPHCDSAPLWDGRVVLVRAALLTQVTGGVHRLCLSPGRGSLAVTGPGPDE